MHAHKLKLDHILKNKQVFDSGPHPPDALLTILPSLGVREPPAGDLTHYGFWYPFILGPNRPGFRVIELTAKYARLLAGVGEGGKLLGKVPDHFKEDLLDPGFFNPLFESPSCSARGYFLRFDKTSAQDVINAHRALKSPLDVIERIVTSQQAIDAINEHLHKSWRVRVYFFPFDATFYTRTDFRCFSAPVSSICKEQKVTAVSQYPWNARGHTNHMYEAFTTAVLERIQSFHNDILEYARMVDPEIAQGLRKQGFVFDIRCLRSGEVQLIEIHDFGLASRCGSALFHWLDDAELLYGGKEDVEVRVIF